MTRKLVGQLAIVLASCALPGILQLRGQTPEFQASRDTQPTFVGPQACAECHAKRVEEVMASPHANSWAPTSALDRLGVGPIQVTVDGITYGVLKENGQWVYQISLPGRETQSFPIHSTVGGTRLGVAMILRVDELEGRKLPKSALVEARYMFGPSEPRFRLAPGFPEETPSNYGNAIGHVLSPKAFSECFRCHGGIEDWDLARSGGAHPERLATGVTCESCHGPASVHIAAARAKKPNLKMAHPGKLPNPQLHQICADCHTGLLPREQPRPVDLTVANQLTALELSECYIQSGEGLSCLTCHNPHMAAAPRGKGYDETCKGCHEPSRMRPHLEAKEGDSCIDCHMPEIVLPEAFHVTDHWIRVVKQ